VAAPPSNAAGDTTVSPAGTVGLFGWQDSLQAPLVVPTIIVESSGIVALGTLAALTWPARSAVRPRRAP
jgi:hypothetical protein